MNTRRLLGLDILKEKYSYGYDPDFGYTASEKIPDKWVKTTCGYCSVGCGMLIGVKEGKPVAVRGDVAHPVNEGKLCPKGLSEHYTLLASNRAKYPLLRQDGELQRVGWDCALDEMVAQFRKVQERYGANSLGVLGTGQLLTEEFYTLGKLVQLGFKTRNYDGNTTLCMASAVAGYKRTFGSDGPPGAYEDFELSDVVVLIGANMADNHPILCQKLEKNRSKKIIVVDPRVSKTAMMSDIHLAIKPRTDVALINGILHVLIAEGMIDQPYIAANTRGFEDLKALAEKYTPEYAAQITGLTSDQILLVARMIGRARAPFFAWTMGVNHSTQGAATVSAICNLSLVMGKVGLAGASPFSITGQCNAMGTRETGFTSGIPGYRKFESEKDRQEIARLWNIDAEEIPTARGYAYPDIIEAILRKEIRALWIIATNPLVSFPNQDTLRQALSNLDFLVVQDGFHPTPTTEIANLVLPAAVWGEKEGTYTNSERRVSKANKAVEPPGEARSDFQIFLDTAEALGVKDRLFPGWSGPRDAFNEWRKVSQGRLCDYSGISYELLDERGSVQWPMREGETDLSPRRLYADGKFETPDGKAILHAVEWEPFPEQPNSDFPFVLNTGRTVEHWHTRTKTGQVAILEAMSPRAWLEMNPRDARKLKLRPHDRVDIVSRRGRVKDVELRITAIVGPGQVFLPFHYAEFNVNFATQSAYDPISREPNFKQSAVRVEKSGAIA
jgi:assimilatory nitrate reductase catalytic subunit